MKKKIVVDNITWDDDEFNEELPSKVEFTTKDFPEEKAEQCHIIDEYLSNEYGFCTMSYSYHVEYY